MIQEHLLVMPVGPEAMTFGSSGGGGGEGAQDEVVEFGPQGSSQEQNGQDLVYATKLTLLQLDIYNDQLAATTIPVKEEPKPATTKKHNPKPIIAENLPTRWVRRGSGPGSGGGAGGGSGGGIGPGTGYSIDWGGTGGRRLLSGRLPKYPAGTDKEMPVTLEFTVLADGSVDAILPVRKTDELLESAAIDALRTWRFDPLPPQYEQRSQVGKVTFVFKLE